MTRGTVLYAPDSTITHVYFPLSGLVSLLIVTGDGDAIETGVVGAEGVVGGGVGTGAFRSLHRAVVQIEGKAMRMDAQVFAKAYGELPVFRGLVNSYQNFVLLQAQQNAACHGGLRPKQCLMNGVVSMPTSHLISRHTLLSTQQGYIGGLVGEPATTPDNNIRNTRPRE